VHELSLTQHTQVLGDSGLAEREPLDELAHRVLALPEQLEDLAARWLGDGGERCHGKHITNGLYIRHGE
jgi:hypothetical protein